jgi:hypothetical protein
MNWPNNSTLLFRSSVAQIASQVVKALRYCRICILKRAFRIDFTTLLYANATTLHLRYFQRYCSPTLQRYSRIYVYAGSSVALAVSKVTPQKIL